MIADRIFGEVGVRQDILDSFDRISARLKLDRKTAEKIGNERGASVA